MHWVGVAGFIGIVIALGILTWAVKSHSRSRADAMKKARAKGDEIRSTVFQLATTFLDKVKSGSDPEQAAEKLRASSVSLIPGREGALPTAAHIETYSTSVFNDSVAESTRRSATIAVIGTSAVAVVTLVVCTVLFQFHSSSESSDPATRPGTSATVQFAQPKFN